MNRRSFIKASAGGVAAILFAPVLERRVFVLDQTMIPDLIVPRHKDFSVYIHGPAEHTMVTGWVVGSGEGIILPGSVYSPDKNMRTYFYLHNGKVQAEVGSHFPKGVGVQSWDREALEEAFYDLLIDSR